MAWAAAQFLTGEAGLGMTLLAVAHEYGASLYIIRLRPHALM